jgi:ATP-dependent Clp protease ATP-binding subunit ClpB
MAKKFTTKAQEALKACLDEALANSNNTAEPEHLLKAILNDQSSMLYMVLTPEERQDIRNLLIRKIGTFAKQYNCPEPRPSEALTRIIMDAEKCKDEYVSLDLLAILLLDTRSIRDLIANAAQIKERVEQKTKGRKYESRNADDASDTISKFAVDMVEQARRNIFDPVIGRENEIRQVIEVLSKKTKSNAMLVGPPGVGKTAIVHGIAQLIANGEAPSLKNAKIYNVDVGAMVAGTAHRGDFEERLKGLIAEAESTPGIILFIDEIHIVLNAGKADGALDAANMLKPGLAAGTIKCIGATTYEEYTKYVEKDPAFERRFVQITVNEPSIEDSITMLRGQRERIELHHGVRISDNALVYAAKASKKYIPSRKLPDIALDLIDTACASAVIALESEPPEILGARSKIWHLELEKASLEVDVERGEDEQTKKRLKDVLEKIEEIKKSIEPLEQEYLKDKSHIIEAKKLKKKLEDSRVKLAQAERDRDTYVAYDIKTNVIPAIEAALKKLESVEVILPIHIAEIIHRWTGIPVKRLTLKENERLLEMSARIKKRIFGQDEAVEAVVDAILQSRVGLSRDNKPIGAFLLLGPTGVGKTELAKAIALELFDDERNMVMLDMSDYSNEMSLTKLIGASAGYVGYNEGGTLTEPVKNKPYNVVLLDEVDLAHQTVLNILYQLLDEGRVTDGKRSVVDFRNCVVIMTSNIGQHVILNSAHVGPAEKQEIERIVLNRFGPPLVNRIDRLIFFNQLGRDSLLQILHHHLGLLNKKLAEKGMVFEVSSEAKEDVIDKVSSSQYGARILKRFIQDNFGHALTKILLMRTDENPMTVHCMLPSETMDGMRIGDYVYVANRP